MVALIGLINAFNLIDGLDGLASGLAVIALAGIGSRRPSPATQVRALDHRHDHAIMVFWLANGMLGAGLRRSWATRAPHCWVSWSGSR